MARLAFTTFAVAQVPFGQPAVEGFLRLEPHVFKQAEASEGFIDRARGLDDEAAPLADAERDYGVWGPMVSPRFYDGGADLNSETRASTLSLWKDLDAVRVFAYSGLHQSAIRQRHKWFKVPDWPSYAMWWVSDTEVPTWADAAWRLDYLMQHGPTGVSFVFRVPFNETGLLVTGRRFDHAPQPLAHHSGADGAEVHDGSRSCFRAHSPQKVGEA